MYDRTEHSPNLTFFEKSSEAAERSLESIIPSASSRSSPDDQDSLEGSISSIGFVVVDDVGRSDSDFRLSDLCNDTRRVMRLEGLRPILYYCRCCCWLYYEGIGH